MLLFYFLLIVRGKKWSKYCDEALDIIGSKLRHSFLFVLKYHFLSKLRGGNVMRNDSFVQRVFGRNLKMRIFSVINLICIF